MIWPTSIRQKSQRTRSRTIMLIHRYHYLRRQHRNQRATDHEGAETYRDSRGRICQRRKHASRRDKLLGREKDIFSCGHQLQVTRHYCRAIERRRWQLENTFDFAHVADKNNAVAGGIEGQLDINANLAQASAVLFN